MKTFHVLCVSLVCVIMFITRTTFATATLDCIYIGLSPYEPQEESKEVRRQIGQFILEGPPNTTIVIDDAYALKEIVRFQIPQLNYDSGDERARRLADPFAKLAAWYKLMAGTQVAPPLNGSSALRIPEFLQFVSHQKSGQPCAVLLMGDPFDQSVEEPAFSMLGDTALTSDSIPIDGWRGLSIQFRRQQQTYIRRFSMSDFKVQIKDGHLIISIPMHPPTRSTSGKTMVVASTHGNKITDAVVDGKPVIVGVNAYIKS